MWGSFVDPRVGWLVINFCCATGNNPVDVFRTADGGQTWEMVYDYKNPPAGGEIPYCYVKLGVTFRDASVGWITSEQRATADIGLYITRDGGRTWKRQALPPADNMKDRYVHIDPPNFFNKQDGVLLAWFGGKGPWPVIAYATHDGGDTWVPTTGIPIGIRATMSFSDPQHGWATALEYDAQPLQVTQDGGRTWQQVSPGPSLKSVLQIQFLNVRDGWALTTSEGGNVLLRTKDGGQTWTDSPW